VNIKRVYLIYAGEQIVERKRQKRRRRDCQACVLSPHQLAGTRYGFQPRLPWYRSARVPNSSVGH
jgi:hypothetical protein